MNPLACNIVSVLCSVILWAYMLSYINKSSQVLTVSMLVSLGIVKRQKLRIQVV